MFSYYDDNNYPIYFGDDQKFMKFGEPQNNETVHNFKLLFDLNDNDFFKENQNFSSSFINSYSSSSLYKYNTNWETLKKDNYFSSKKEFNQEDESNYDYISLEEIQKIFKNKNFEFDNKIIKNKSIENAEFKLCNRKRKRENDSIVLFKNEKEAAGDKTKRRRKVNTNNKEYYKMEHNENPEVYINKKN